MLQDSENVDARNLSSMFSVLYPENSDEDHKIDDIDESGDENDQGDVHDEAAAVASYSREAHQFLSNTPPGGGAQLSRQCGLPTCSQRGQLRKCAGCAAIWYCGVAHQTLHWPHHQLACHVVVGEIFSPAFARTRIDVEV